MTSTSVSCHTEKMNAIDSPYLKSGVWPAAKTPLQEETGDLFFFAPSEFLALAGNRGAEELERSTRFPLNSGSRPGIGSLCAAHGAGGVSATFCDA